MMENWYRLAFCCLLVLLLVPIYLTGRSVSPHGEGGRPAFFHSGSDTVRIRISGSVSNPGVYDVPVGTTAAGAIKLTVVGWADATGTATTGSHVLHGGEVLFVPGGHAPRPGIMISNMLVREKMLLGIRLNPNTMNQDDWEALPGIGPALARRILEYRQNYGDYGSIDELKFIPGVGEGTMLRLYRFF